MPHKIPTLILFLTISNVLHSQSFEQLATDYFFGNIFQNDFSEYSIIEFSGQSDSTANLRIGYTCDNWDDTVIEKIVSSNPGLCISISANNSPIKIKKMRKNSSRLKLIVSSAIEVDKSHFVLIQVYRKLRFVEYYFLEFNNDNQLKSLCRSSEII